MRPARPALISDSKADASKCILELSFNFIGQLSHEEDVVGVSGLFFEGLTGSMLTTRQPGPHYGRNTRPRRSSLPAFPAALLTGAVPLTHLRALAKTPWI